ncbi:MAG: hypothetical protein ACRC3I_11145 [Cetobacterium sp.]
MKNDDLKNKKKIPVKEVEDLKWMTIPIIGTIGDGGKITFYEGGEEILFGKNKDLLKKDKTN